MSSFEDSPDAPFYPMEASAREIADTVLSHQGQDLRRELPPEAWQQIKEMMAGAVHDGIEFGESIASLPNQGPSGLEHYTHGYLDAIEDIGMKEEGE